VTPEARAIAERVGEIEWYHAIELPHGVVTPGRVDHRRQVDLYGLPDDMRGMRVLDVATFDGFWAFEMERRGAEVVAIDIASWGQADIPLRWRERMTPDEDAPTGAGFRLAKELLRSNVERRELSVYDLTPKEVGAFDVVVVSDLLLHLRDPQRALENVYTVTREGGVAVVAEPYSPDLEGFKDVSLSQFIGYEKFVWSIPSIATLKARLDLAGFEPVEEVSRFRLDYRHPFPVQKVVLKSHPRPRNVDGR
jgi:tRNA (mo5U34)-methyltransferase